MEYKKLFLKDITNRKVGDESFVEFYLNEKNSEINIEPRLGMIVLPGGGYDYCSQREAEPIALRYMSEGFNCFVLHYTCKTSYPLPHAEVAALFEFIQNNTQKLNILPNHISIVGFSAGGHLASSYGIVYKEFEEKYNLEKDFLKPLTLILAYPVTNLFVDTNSLTRSNITGDKEELRKKLSVPQNIKEDYPPTYIWTTKTDECVPIIHSLQLIDSLKNNNVPHQFDMFEKGIHGGSLCNHGVYDINFDFESIKENKKWIENSVDFIYKNLK